MVRLYRKRSQCNLQSFGCRLRITNIIACYHDTKISPNARPVQIAYHAALRAGRDDAERVKMTQFTKDVDDPFEKLCATFLGFFEPQGVRCVPMFRRQSKRLISPIP